VPPDPHATDDGVTTLHGEMVKSWNQRIAQVPSTWSARTVPLGGSTGAPVTLSDLISRLETHATATVRASTLTTYQYTWQTILRTIPAMTLVNSLTSGLLLVSITKVQTEGLSPKSVRRHVAQLKRLCAYAVEQGLLAQDPSVGIKLPKVPKRLPRFLSPEERDRLLLEAEKKGRDYHLLGATGVYLGLRKAEMNALCWSDIDFEKRLVQVVNSEHFTTKSGKPRAIPICDEMLTIFQRYRQAGGFVMAPRKKYRDKARYRWEFRDGFVEMVIAAKLDVRVITPHALRHTFASTLAQRGVSLYKIAAWMGHSSASVTELYAHLTAYDDDIRRLNNPSPEEVQSRKQGPA
jgi:integrase/recombinase XerD